MERPGEGTKFTLDRKIFSSDIWFASPWKLKIFLYLLGNANHKNGNWKGIALKRGEVIRSYRRIAQDCGYKIGYRWKRPSISTVSQICEELTKELRIERRTERGAQIITILNYDDLQPLRKHEPNDETKDYRTITEHNNNDKEYTSSYEDEQAALIEETKKKIFDKARILKAGLVFEKAENFAGQMLKKGMHPGAVLFALEQCIKYKPKEPFPYCLRICQKESGNLYEAEHHLRSREQYGEGRQD